MKFTLHLLKPEKKMKTVTHQMEKCLQQDCKGCWLKNKQFCQDELMASGLYYLKQTIEKSEKNNGIPKVRQ